MSLNELTNNSGPIGAWSQFVTLKEAANKRNFNPSGSAYGASGASGGKSAPPKFSDFLSSPGGDNVYLNPNVKALQDTLAAVRAKDMPAKGKMFDSYA